MKWNLVYPSAGFAMRCIACSFISASCLTNILTNGTIIVSPNHMGPGPWVRNNTAATYSCELGFTHLTDSTAIRCLKGEWQQSPKCVPSKCHLTLFILATAF